MHPRPASIIAVLLVLIACSVAASIPQTLSYQGVLRDDIGNVVSDGDYSIAFRIYNVETGGGALWAETQSVSVTDGVFNAILGSSLPLALPFDVPYWLGISVGADPELAPRAPLTSVPYAQRAAYADAGDDGDWVVSGDDIYRLEGYVGVGTETPLYDLDIRRDANAGVGIRITNENTESNSHEGIFFDNEAGYGAGLVVADDDSYYGAHMALYNNRAGGYLRFNTAATERLRITNDGDVGIGVMLPSHLLDVGGTVKVLGFQMPTGAASGHVLTSDGSGYGTWAAQQAVSDGDWAVSGNNMSSAVSGNVGIGTSSPQDKLEVKGNLRLDQGAGNGNTLRFVEGGVMKWAFLYRPWVNGNLTVLDEVSLARAMTFESGTGDVGIKTEHPETDLHVVGDTKLQGNLEVTGTITQSAKTRYLTVPPAAFTPSHPDDTGYTITDGIWASGTSYVYFVAPVQLPDGATITSVKHGYYDDSGYDSSSYLYRREVVGISSSTMAHVPSSGSSGTGSSTDTTITDPVVDNANYSYFLSLAAIDDIVTYGIVIEYTTAIVD